MKRMLMLAAVAGAALASPLLRATEVIDPARYPKLSAHQLSVLRYIVDRSHQPLEQWPRAQFGYGPTAGSTNPADSDLIYQVRADASALAIAQYDKLPAYRELYQRSMNALIQKMLQPETWGAWYELSRWEDGLLFAEGDGKLQPWADPFKKHNIMYSGNLFQMLGYYAMLYNDRKYDAPGSLTYVWSKAQADRVGAHYDGPEQVFRYDYNSLAAALRRQFADTDYVGIACQPKYAFTLCNQVWMLGYRHYDMTHGTHHAPEIERRFFANEKWDERTQRFMIFVNQETREPQLVQPEQQIAGDPIGGMMWHYAINRKRVAKSYRYHRDIGLKFCVGNIRDAIRDGGIGCGFFATYAAEVGDLETRDKLIRYADKNFGPVLENGAFHYAITDVDVPEPPKEQHFENWQGNDHRVGKRTVFGGQANSLMAMAAVIEGGAHWRIYNEPWTQAHFREPYISGVDYPRVLVNQAIYDRARDALIVGLEPGAENVGRISFDINQLDPAKTYAVEIGGKTIGRVNRGKPSSPDMQWSADKVLTLQTSLDKPSSIVIRAEAER